MVMSGACRREQKEDDMTDQSETGARGRAGVWLPVAAVAGLGWNLFGLWQFAGSLRQTGESLMAAGMTAEQAEIYLALPGWMTAVFAVGVIGGAVGSVLLLLRRAAAVPVYAASLAGYVALFLGDLAYGVFAGMPEQLVIITTVVLIAVVLFALSLFARKRAILR
jgi:hypothetical protein